MKKLISFIALTGLTSAVAFATNSALVDTLEKKGYLSAQEVAALNKTGAMSSSRQHTQSISFDGLVQVQYDYFNTTTNGGTEETRKNRSVPSIRNVKLGIHAGLTDHFSADLVFGNTTTDERTNVAGNMEIDTALVKWTPMDEFNMAAGFDSTPFGYENGIATKDMKTLDRGVTARYFEHVLGFGRENVGLFISGELNDLVEGLYYKAFAGRDDGLADNGQVSHTGLPAFMGQLGLRNSIQEVDFDIGLNAGAIVGLYDPTATDAARNQFYALGVYAHLMYERVTLLTEFNLAFIENARPASAGENSATHPFGLTIMPSFKITDDFEAVVRYAFLNSGGTKTFTDKGPALPVRGSTASDLVRGSAGTTSGVAEVADFAMKTWHQFYIGGNWYYLGNDLKVSFGYDYTHGETVVDAGFAGASPTGGTDKVAIHHAGARVQLLF